MLACVPMTVERVLEDEGLNLDDVDVIVPPLVSAEFASRLARQLEADPDRVIIPPESCKDLYTSSIPYGLAEIKRQGKDKSGNVALLLVCGSGIQVGAAIYHF
jgi:3-oxoacyl-[acyl-carrier-protein] synthase III